MANATPRPWATDSTWCSAARGCRALRKGGIVETAAAAVDEVFTRGFSRRRWGVYLMIFSREARIFPLRKTRGVENNHHGPAAKNDFRCAQGIADRSLRSA